MKIRNNQKRLQTCFGKKRRRDRRRNRRRKAQR